MVAKTKAENLALARDVVIALSAARMAVMTWMDPQRRNHGEAMEVLGRALAAVARAEQGEDGGHLP